MMPECEIVDLPPLKPNEQSLVEMHSLLNIFNVLRGELTLIGLQLDGDDRLLSAGLDLCTRLIAALRDPVASLAAAEAVDAHATTIFSEIDTVLERHPGSRDHPEIQESLANLHSVFAILRVRARELLARHQHPGRWLEIPLEQLRHNFREVFSAIERNSHGRYRILYNAALKQSNDYYVDFKLESVHDDHVWMPEIFQDVMRDLVANARKYTPPGGHITLALHESDDALRLLIEDTGRGIPPDEITTVVQFGRRASNVADVRTMGGGFGLTKAVLATKQFGGRFWIASEVGTGTRIRIVLPREPKPAAEEE